MRVDNLAFVQELFREYAAITVPLHGAVIADDKAEDRRPALAWTRAKAAGNMPSSAAASGTRPCSMIQPLRASKVDTKATSAITLSQPRQTRRRRRRRTGSSSRPAWRLG